MNITGGKYNGRKIKAPNENIVRPTLSKVRMSVFNTLFSILENFEEKTFLDMFGGSGIMGLEALSRGFKEVLVFEKNKKVAEIIKSNYKTLDLIPDIIIGDSLKLLQENNKFDVIYIDPPYMSGLYEQIIDIIKNYVKGSIIVFEHVIDLDFKDLEIIKQKKYGDKFMTYLRA